MELSLRRKGGVTEVVLILYLYKLANLTSPVGTLSGADIWRSDYPYSIIFRYRNIIE